MSLYPNAPTFGMSQSAVSVAVQREVSAARVKELRTEVRARIRARVHNVEATDGYSRNIQIDPKKIRRLRQSSGPLFSYDAYFAFHGHGCIAAANHFQHAVMVYIPKSVQDKGYSHNAGNSESIFAKRKGLPGTAQAVLQVSGEHVPSKTRRGFVTEFSPEDQVRLELGMDAIAGLRSDHHEPVIVMKITGAFHSRQDFVDAFSDAVHKAPPLHLDRVTGKTKAPRRARKSAAATHPIRTGLESPATLPADGNMFVRREDILIVADTLGLPRTIRDVNTVLEIAENIPVAGQLATQLRNGLDAVGSTITRAARQRHMEAGRRKMSHDVAMVSSRAQACVDARNLAQGFSRL